jgi:hypothetical protein
VRGGGGDKVADRTLLIQRYLVLHTRAVKMGIRGTPHITTQTPDDLIITWGKALAERIKAAEAERDKSNAKG